MDSLKDLESIQDEQIRGITMKASAIALVYDDNVINLIDSPGHVDFSDEVSSVLLLSDIAFLVIDVVCRKFSFSLNFEFFFIIDKFYCF